MSSIITLLALLMIALLFGGMVLFSFGFAAFLFSALPKDLARKAIRQAFPHFYAFVIASAGLAAALVYVRDTRAAVALIVIASTAVLARQVLMPAINRATDAGAKARFKWLHAASVVLTLLHIGLAGIALARFV